ncbi:hypothetical protein ACRAWD_21205 [Caulobacter segnis]
MRMGVTIGGVEDTSEARGRSPGRDLRPASGSGLAPRPAKGAPTPSSIPRRSASRPSGLAAPPRVVVAARPTVAVEPVAPLAPLIVNAGKRPPRLGSLPGGVSVIGSPQAAGHRRRRDRLGRPPDRRLHHHQPGRGPQQDPAAGSVRTAPSRGRTHRRSAPTSTTCRRQLPQRPRSGPAPDRRRSRPTCCAAPGRPARRRLAVGHLSHRHPPAGERGPSRARSALEPSAKAESGSNSYRVEGVINAPVRENAAVRLAIYHDADGGYLDDPNLRLSNVDKTTRRGGRVARLGLDLGDWKVQLGVAGQEHLVQGHPVRHPPAPGGPRRANQVRETHRNRLSRDPAEDQRISLGDWGSSPSRVTGYVTHNYASRYDATLALTEFSEEALELGLYDESAKVRMGRRGRPLQPVRNWGACAGWSACSPPPAFEESDADLRARSGAASPAAITTRTASDRLNEYAVYGEADLRPGRRLEGRPGRTFVQDHGPHAFVRHRALSR